MKLNIQSNIDFRYAGLVSGVVLLVGLILSNFLIPSIVNMFIKKMVILMPGSFFRQSQDQVSSTLNIYMFNVTNPDEVLNGGIPKMQEIGPYVYE